MPQEESYRATLAVRTPGGERHTLIITRRGTGRDARTWLTFDGAYQTTAVLTGEQCTQLQGMLDHSAGSAR